MMKSKLQDGSYRDLRLNSSSSSPPLPPPPLFNLASFPPFEMFEDLRYFHLLCYGIPGGSEVKASAWNVGDPDLIPGLGRSPGEGRATHSSTLVYKIPWTEEPGRLQSMGLQRVRHD